MRSGNASSHDSGAENPNSLHLARLHVGIGDARIFLQPLRHEKECDQISRDWTADQGHEALGLDAKRIIQWEIASLFDSVQSGQRRGKLAFGLGFDGGTGDVESERRLILAESHGSALFLALQLPVAA